MFKFIHTKNLWVYTLLQIEESLLRNSHENWCIINEGTSAAVVHGVKYTPILSPLQQIQRFSGGGSVVVDENTIFLTFILSEQKTPQEMMQWVFAFLQKALSIKGLACVENDYVINHKKCGGNAQYFTASRSLQHTSLLWNYDPIKMNMLPYPKKTPVYRSRRSHEDFLCRLKDYFPTKEMLINKLIDQLSHTQYSLQKIEEILKESQNFRTKILA